MEINLNTARDICSIIQTNKSKTIQFKIIVILNQFKNYLVDLEWRKRSKLSNRINEELDARAWQVHLHRGSFILDRRGEKVEACPNQNSILVARSLVFLRPISASFPAEEVDNREETAARVHTSRRGVLCNRGCQGGEHTHPFLPYYGSHAGVRRVQRVTRFPKDSVTADFAISKDSFCKCDFSPLDRFESCVTRFVSLLSGCIGSN